MSMHSGKRRTVIAAAMAAVVGLGFAAEQQGAQPDKPDMSSGAAQRASARVNSAIATVRKLEADPRIRNILPQAKGILIVPSYGKAALGVGAHGGGGLLMLKHPDGAWSGPAFYDLGGLSLGLQAGIEGGPVALVLMNDKAVRETLKKNNFSLSADAGLTVLNWSKLAQGYAGTGDVIAWSATTGLLGDAVAVGLNDVRFNQTLTNAYYGRALSPQAVTEGSVSNAEAEPLRRAMASASSPVQ